MAWNDTSTDYQSEKTLVKLFECIAGKYPDFIAVSFDTAYPEDRIAGKARDTGQVKE